MCRYIETHYQQCKCYTYRLWKECHEQRGFGECGRGPSNVEVHKKIDAVCFECIDRASVLLFSKSGKIKLSSLHRGIKYIGEWNDDLKAAAEAKDAADDQEADDQMVIYMQRIMGERHEEEDRIALEAQLKAQENGGQPEEEEEEADESVDGLMKKGRKIYEETLPKDKKQYRRNRDARTRHL